MLFVKSYIIYTLGSIMMMLCPECLFFQGLWYKIQK